MGVPVCGTEASRPAIHAWAACTDGSPRAPTHDHGPVGIDGNGAGDVPLPLAPPAMSSPAVSPERVQSGRAP